MSRFKVRDSSQPRPGKAADVKGRDRQKQTRLTAGSFDNAFSGWGHKQTLPRGRAKSAFVH